MVEQMREVTENAARTTRKARRDAERRATSTAPKTDRSAGTPKPPAPTGTAAAPFADIEQW